MYIRRKVFSVAYDENGEEKLFSTTEIMSEEAYLEKLYSESEEQKEFASIRKSKKLAKQIANVVENPKISSQAEYRKRMGQIESRLDKNGIRKNRSKFAQTKDVDKVAKGYINATEKTAKIKIPDQSKSEFVTGFKKEIVK